MRRWCHNCLALVAALGGGAAPVALKAQELTPAFDAAIQRQFLEGMNAYAARHYGAAEASFRRILDRNPSLLRVRLELARTLFMEKKDEQADYQFATLFVSAKRYARGGHGASMSTSDLHPTATSIRQPTSKASTSTDCRSSWTPMRAPARGQAYSAAEKRRSG